MVGEAGWDADAGPEHSNIDHTGWQDVGIDLETYFCREHEEGRWLAGEHFICLERRERGQGGCRAYLIGTPKYTKLAYG